MGTQRVRLSWGSWVWWTVVTGTALALLVVGGALLGVMSGGGYVGGHLGIILGGGSYGPLAPIESGYLGGFAGGAIGGALAGLLCGLGQWMVVRRRVSQAAQAGHWWVGLTILGFALGGAFSAGGFAGGAIGRMLALFTSQLLGVSAGIADSVGLPLGWLFSMAAFGSLVGVCQWLALRRWVRPDLRGRASRWILFSAIAWLMGWAIGYLMSKLIGWPVANAIHPTLEYPLNIVMGEGLGWLIGWLAVGAITGASFFFLRAQPVPGPDHALDTSATQLSVAQVPPTATPQSDGLEGTPNHSHASVLGYGMRFLE